MAKSVSKNAASKAPKKRSKKITKSSLVALPTNLSAVVNVNFTFTSGLGQATASLFRNGILINMQSISTSGVIRFADVQTGDVISINGVCTGTATISINVPTVPSTPKQFPAGVILSGFLII